jgi:hypothetical protein
VKHLYTQVILSKTQNAAKMLTRSKFQRSQISNELIPPAHTEPSVTSSSRSALARDLVVNLLYRLVDHLFRGFHSADDQF